MAPDVAADWGRGIFSVPFASTSIRRSVLRGLTRPRRERRASRTFVLLAIDPLRRDRRWSGRLLGSVTFIKAIFQAGPRPPWRAPPGGNRLETRRPRALARCRAVCESRYERVGPGALVDNRGDRPLATMQTPAGDFGRQGAVRWPVTGRDRDHPRSFQIAPEHRGSCLFCTAQDRSAG